VRRLKTGFKYGHSVISVAVRRSMSVAYFPLRFYSINTHLGVLPFYWPHLHLLLLRLLF